MIITDNDNKFEEPRAVYNFEFNDKISDIEDQIQTLKDRIDNLNECLAIILRRLKNE